MLRTRTFNIKAGEGNEVAVDGDYVRVQSAAVPLYLENTETGDRIEINEGDDVQGWPFKRLLVSHDSGADQEIKLTIGKGPRVGSAKVGGSVALDGQQGAFTQGRASVTNVNQAIIAANAARRFLMIQNNDVSQTLRVTLDGNAATAAQGFRIGPGDSLDLSGYQSTAAINAIMEAASVAADNVEFAEG